MEGAGGYGQFGQKPTFFNFIFLTLPYTLLCLKNKILHSSIPNSNYGWGRLYLNNLIKIMFLEQFPIVAIFCMYVKSPNQLNIICTLV